MRRLAAVALFALAVRASAQMIPVAEPLLGPVPGGVFSPVAAASRDVMVAAWSSSACGGTCVQRIAADGTLLDVPAIMVPGMSSPYVASDGDRFLLMGASESALRMALMDRSGAVTPIAPLDGTPFAVAGNASSYAVLLQRPNTYDTPIDFLRLDRNGNPLGPKVKTSFVRYSAAPALAMNDAGVALALTVDSGTIAVVDLGTAPTVAVPIPSAVDGYAPSIASNGSGFLAAWITGKTGRQSIVTQSLDDKGSPIGDPVSFPAPFVSGFPAKRMTWTGTDYRIAWMTNENGHYTLRNAIWNRTAITPVTLTESDTRMDLVGISATFAVWSDARYNTPQPEWLNDYSRRGTNQLFGTSGLISITRQEQSPGPLLACGDSYYAAWRERGGPQRVRLSRFKNGKRVEPAGAGLPLFNDATFVDQDVPALACGGNQFAVAWLETDRAAAKASVYMALYPNGDLASIPRFVALSDDADPIGGLAAVFDGERFVIAWRSRSSKQIVALRTTNDGSRIDAFPIVLTDTGATINGDAGPLLSWNGREFLLVWQHLPSASDSSSANVMAWRFTRELTPLALPARIDTAASIVTSSRVIRIDYATLTATTTGWSLGVSSPYTNVAARLFELDASGLPVRKIDLNTAMEIRGLAAAGDAPLVAWSKGVLLVRDGKPATIFSDSQTFVWSVATGGDTAMAFVSVGARAGVVPLVSNRRHASR